MRNIFLIPFCLSTMVVLGSCDEQGIEQVVEERVEAPSGRVLSTVPDLPNINDDFLIYLHGAIVETEGMRPTHPRFGIYEYSTILQTFADRGFTVISEVRPAKTHPDAYARRVVTQVQALLDAGVPEQQITIVGFSKGGIIATLASSKIIRTDVKWVILAGCGTWVGKLPDMVPNGRILSILDSGEDMATSCEDLFSRMPEGAIHDELTTQLGSGHGAFYTPDSSWVEPTIEWAGR
ncbi:MAG: alpha/beta hydrolase [Thermoanaerobaculales bacterium]|nr:alpha/beta hydrolase [Thermoanaerobaculales bacterium]